MHVTYTLLGLGYLVSEFSWILGVIRCLGAGYLIWLGISAFIKSRSADSETVQAVSLNRPSLLRSFCNGFLCNALNPKTVIFFIALFTQVVSPGTPVAVLAGLGLFISGVHFIWFAFVVLLLTDSRCSRLFVRYRVQLEKFVGACLMGLGIRLAVDV